MADLSSGSPATPHAQKDSVQAGGEEKSFFQIVVHSFFIIPFLIAVFCVLLFTAMKLLTEERRTAYDYLEDVKIGGLTKRWQGAFELSKILSNPALIPADDRFTAELIAAFEQAKHDDHRVRQYLALAMGRTGRKEFIAPLLEGLRDEKEDNLAALIYALGMLSDSASARSLHEYADHPVARIRSITMVALGNIASEESRGVLRNHLHDPEPNVQWGAALSLAKIRDLSGKEVIIKLLDRSYLSQFSEVDLEEQDYMILAAMEAVSYFSDPDLNKRIQELSQSDQNMQVRSKALDIIKNFGK